MVWLLVSALYSPIIYQLYTQRWETIDYTHAYFILPLSLFFAWRRLKKGDVPRLKAGGQALGDTPFYSFILILLGLFMFIFGWRMDYLFISTLSLIPLLYGLVIYLYGAKTAKALSFPILYLLLMVPPPLGVLDAITMPMRHGVSVISADILKFFHYPIHREGLTIYLGSHEIFMGAPCSGFRSLITMLSLGMAYVYVIKGGFLKKSILVAAIIPLALFGNLIRVITLCLLTYHAGEKVAQGFLHYFSGGVIFVIMIIGLLALEAILEKRELRTTT